VEVKCWDRRTFLGIFLAFSAFHSKIVFNNKLRVSCAMVDILVHGANRRFLVGARCKTSFNQRVFIVVECLGR
jgi:hypothetical protein